MSIPTPFNPLGTLGAEPLPPGYIRLAACRFNQRQGFYTGVYLTEDFILCADIKGNSYATTTAAIGEMCVFSGRGDYGSPSYGSNTYCVAQRGENTIGVYSFLSHYEPSFIVDEPVINERNKYVWARGYTEFNGERRNGEMTFFPQDEIHVGYGKGSNERQLHADVYELAMYNGADLLRKYIPAIDPDGRTCFFEAIEQKAVYSELSADFIPVY